jgi:hypothetical protein
MTEFHVASPPSDCLVFRIKEFEDDPEISDTYDNEIFILYDTYYRTYVIRGKRRCTNSVKSKPFSFECREYADVLAFLTLMIEPEAVCTVELYNYLDLPRDSSEITHRLLHLGRNKANEMVAFDGLIFGKTTLIGESISILRYVRNKYDPFEEDEDEDEDEDYDA